MNLIDVLTLEALQAAMAVRQARRELEAAILMAEIVLRERAQKNRPARERRTVLS